MAIKVFGEKKKKKQDMNLVPYLKTDSTQIICNLSIRMKTLPHSPAFVAQFSYSSPMQVPDGYTLKLKTKYCGEIMDTFMNLLKLQSAVRL